MQVSWLQLCLPRWEAIASIEDPGIWSLFKIRGLPHLTISGPHRCIAPKVRACLKARTHKKKLFPWQPLGIENPGPNNWAALVPHRHDRPPWRQQFEWLDARYKYLHDRETVAARRVTQRIAYHKRRRRWPYAFQTEEEEEHSLASAKSHIYSRIYTKGGGTGLDSVIGEGCGTYANIF